MSGSEFSLATADPGTVGAYMQATEEAEHIRRAAIMGLGRLGDRAALPVLRRVAAIYAAKGRCQPDTESAAIESEHRNYQNALMASLLCGDAEAAGRVVDFLMNDKCAAGTGRFLEVMAKALELGIEDLGHISLQAQKPLQISSTCTVFAESEVVTLVAEGVNREDIVAGLHEAIATRAVGMLRRFKIEPDVVFTGGVAKNTGVVKAVRENLGYEVLVPDDPLVSGALGAALLGKELTLKAKAKGETIQRVERKLTEATFFK